MSVHTHEKEATDYTRQVGLRATTHIADAILFGVSAGLDADAVEGVLDAGLTATQEACRSTHHLVDFDEWLGREAL